MMQLLKKIFIRNKPKTVDSSMNKELIEQLYNFIHTENVLQLLSSPEAKIMLLNVYNYTFDEFINNIFNERKNKSLMAVNIYCYFKDTEDIIYKIKRLIPILQTTKIDIVVAYELTEIINNVEFLMSLKAQNGKQS